MIYIIISGGNTNSEEEEKILNNSRGFQKGEIILIPEQIKKKSFGFKSLILFFSVFFSISFLFYPSTKKKLTYKQVYLGKGEKLFKPLPYFEKWKNERSFIRNVSVKKGKKTERVSQLVDIVTGKVIRLSKDKPGKNFPKDFKFSSYLRKSKDGYGYLFKKKGLLFYYSLKKDSFITLVKDAGEIKNPHFSPDGEYVAYTQKGDLFVVSTVTAKITRVTRDGSDKIYNGYSSWVYYEEILGRRTRYKAFWWSPDSKRIVFFRFDDSKVPEFTVTGAKGVHGIVEVTPYPKPGDPSPDVNVGVYDLTLGKTLFMDAAGDSDIFYAEPKWEPEIGGFLLQKINRGQDHLFLYRVDAVTGKRVLIHEEKQDSWIDFYNDIYILKKNRGFIITSDVDGWKHLYYFDMKGKLKKRLTKGNWRVRSIQKVDEKHGVVYFTGFMEKSTDNHLFRVTLKGKGLRKLSSGRGNHYIQLSPGFKYFIDTYSSIKHPRVRKLYRINGKFVKKLGDSKTPAMKKYKFGKSELFTIPSGDGFDLPAVWTLPPDLNTSKKYPVLIRIYGGPDSGTVRNYYQRLSSYYFAQNGIIVLLVDHRGSGHFGKKGVALMHRNLGKWEMHDYIAAVKWLRGKSFVDPKRIGITGGSYGGYVTCMAMTYGADYFTHGIASSSVTDWKLYDSFYTEKFMDKPSENPKGYKKGSVMEYAKKLKGKLLIVHGEMDDNVHMQNSIQLISKLQDLNKDFELMVYPGGRHGWRGKKRIHSTRRAVQFWFRNFLNRELAIEKD